MADLLVHVARPGEPKWRDVEHRTNRPLPRVTVDGKYDSTYSDGVPDYEIPMPVLLREARGAFGTVIRHEIERRGLPRLPRDGAYVLGALHFEEMDLASVIHRRERSMERNQTISHLVEGGYLEDIGMGLTLSERGVEGALAVAEAVGGLYHELGHAVGEDGIATLRQGLLALIEIKESAEDHHHEHHGHSGDEHPHGGEGHAH
jgi:hypothetical protein